MLWIHCDPDQNKVAAEDEWKTIAVVLIWTLDVLYRICLSLIANCISSNKLNVPYFNF